MEKYIMIQIMEQILKIPKTLIIIEAKKICHFCSMGYFIPAIE